MFTLTHRTAYILGTTDVGGVPMRNDYCPFAGKSHFKYSVNNDYDILENNGNNLKDECISSSSELDNCPLGSHLHLEFKKCSFENHGNSSCVKFQTSKIHGSLYLSLINEITL